jgi:outer membrane receptor protein involved in Fe transport
MDHARVRTLGRPFLLPLPLLLLLGIGAPAYGQQAGRVVGRVIDTQTGAGMSGVVVEVVGTDVGTLSGVDGRYVLAGVPAGTVALTARNLGYGAKTVTGLRTVAGGVVELNITLEPQAVELEGIEVSAAAERGSVTRALDQQRTAAGIVNAITSEQIARSPDGDAAAAMQRVSGVTVRDGREVYVRGLGERYTTTSLNGARIPSPEPERRVVPLDLFPSALLQTITTSKTFTPDQPGDFSGAQVDIRTREFPAERQASWSLGFGYNDAVTGRTAPRAPSSGAEWLGFAGRGRELPGIVRAAGNFSSPPTQVDMNRMVRAFRNAWSPLEEGSAPNVSAGFTIGHPVAYLATATYSLNQEARTDEVRALALAAAGGSTEEIDRFVGETGRTSVLWGGLVNLSTLVGSRTRFALNTSYNRTADNEARFEFGSSENHGGLPLQVQRLRFVERSVLSNQLVGEHELGDGHRLDWTLSGSTVERNEPDRSEIVYAVQTDAATGQPLPPTWFSASNEGAVRTFGALSESSLEAAANYRLEIGGAGHAHYLKVGGLYRATDRDADSRAYSISAGRLDAASRGLRPEEIFDGRFSTDADEVFIVVPLGQGGAYDAHDRLAAGYAMLELALSDRLRLIGGARYERSRTRVDAQPTIGENLVSDTTWTDILPALTLNVKLSDRQNLRFSATRTLSRPEYRELAGVMYREVLGGDNVLGNPSLRRTLIQNADVRWEWYPSSGEVLSVALFGKRFDDPIERVYLATSGTRVVTFVNAEGAENYGVEVEARKRLGTLSPAFEPWTVFANATVMKSDIRIGASAASVTNDNRAMVGQAPYVLNAGVTYASTTGANSATLLYNVVGKRIVSAAETPLPDVYEQPRHVLDLSLRYGLTGSLAAKLDVRNLLDEPYEITQGVALREFYRAGRVFSAGLSLKR